jgi:hypothetical protein
MIRLILISALSMGSLVAADLRATHDTTENPLWPRHVIEQGFDARTAIGGDVTGDGKADIITNFNGHTRLFVGPDFKQEVVIGETRDVMHSELMDVDDDGDLDYVGAVFDTGPVFWLENPADPMRDLWVRRVIDGTVTGIHGLIQGDIDGDGKNDLVGNSSLAGRFPISLVWWKIPPHPTRPTLGWIRNVFADRDAPGRSHYTGIGDLNGDGRLDIAAAAKNEPMGNWFAWWEQPADGSVPWKKHMLADNEYGATNILAGDFNGDGVTDLFATRGHGTGVLWFEGPDFVQHEVNTELAAPHNLTLGDIDGDGDLDAVTASKVSFVTAWFENDGKGSFKTHHIFSDQGGYDIRLVDLDGDSDLDVLVAGDVSLNVVWYENRLGE